MVPSIRFLNMSSGQGRARQSWYNVYLLKKIKKREGPEFKGGWKCDKASWQCLVLQEDCINLVSKYSHTSRESIAYKVRQQNAWLVDDKVADA